MITACKQNEPVIRQLKSPMGLSELVMNFYKASVEFGGQSKEIQQYTLFDAFQMLNELQLPVLLCLDEVQHLAKKPEFDNFVASLHDFMVNRSDDLIKGIFIGSSYEGLEKRLRENTAQLYSSEPSIEFKSLDIDFVQFELSMFKKVTGNIELNEKQALDIFIIQQREPARFVEMLKKMVLSGTYDLAEGLANFDQKQEFSAEFEEVHQKLHPIDFGILKLISLDQAGGLYTDEGMRKLLIIVGDESVRVSTSSINNALRRLKKSNILFSPKRGVLAFENQEFETYMNQKR